MSPEFIAHLRDLLDYDPATGLFRYKRRRGRKRIGDLAGYVDKQGYHCIKVTFNGHKRAFPSARLAVAIVTGQDPAHRVVSHRNQYRSDNRWDNLVVLSAAQRALRSPPGSTNTSGCRGVCWIPSRNKWEASIRTPEAFRHLGYFDRFVDAAAARHAAVLQQMPPSMGGPLRTHYARKG